MNAAVRCVIAVILLSLSVASPARALQTSQCGESVIQSAGLVFSLTIARPATLDISAPGLRPSYEISACIENISAGNGAQITIDLTIPNGGVFTNIRQDALITVPPEGTSTRIAGLRFDPGQAETFTVLLSSRTDAAGEYRLTPFVALNGIEVNAVQQAAPLVIFDQTLYEQISRKPDAAIEYALLPLFPFTPNGDNEPRLFTASDTLQAAVLFRNTSDRSRNLNFVVRTFGGLTIADPAQAGRAQVTLSPSESRIVQVMLRPSENTYPGRYMLQAVLTPSDGDPTAEWITIPYGEYQFPLPVAQTDQAKQVQSGLYLAGIAQRTDTGGELQLWLENASDALTHELDLTITDPLAQLTLDRTTINPDNQTLLDSASSLSIRRVVLGPREGVYLIVPFGINSVQGAVSDLSLRVRVEDVQVSDRPIEQIISLKTLE